MVVDEDSVFGQMRRSPQNEFSLLILIRRLIKVILVTFVSVSLIRVSMARFRINTIVTLYWGWLTAAGLIGMGLIILDGMLVAGGCFA